MENYLERSNQIGLSQYYDQKIARLSQILRVLDFIPIIALIFSIIISIIISTAACQSNTTSGALCQFGLMFYGIIFLIPILAITQSARGLISASIIKHSANIPTSLNTDYATRAKANAIITTIALVALIVFSISFLLLMLNWQVSDSTFFDSFYNLFSSLAWICAVIFFLLTLCNPLFAKIIQNHCRPSNSSHTLQKLSFIGAITIPVLMLLTSIAWLTTNNHNNEAYQEQYEEDYNYYLECDTDEYDDCID